MIDKARQSSYDSGAASEFLVLSTLYRLGVNAFISLGNKKSIDIIVKAKSGQSLSVDVKSVRGYTSVVVNNVIPAPNHFIVVVVYKNKFEDPTTLPDFYIIPSERIPEIRSEFNGEHRLMKGKLKEFRDAWEQLRV